MSKSLQEFRLEQRFRRRLYVFAGLIFFLALLFISQLASLQLISGYENRILAKKFVSHQEFTVAPRGLIFDRHGQPGDEPLVQNLRFIDFIIHPDQFASRKAAIDYVKLFCSIMAIPYSHYAPYLRPRAWKALLRKNEYITLIKRMSRREHERLASFHVATEHGEYVTQYLRHYTMGPALAHVSGYIGLPSLRELKKQKIQPYQTLGKSGLEAEYDRHLRGRDGVRTRHRIVDKEEQLISIEQGNNIFLNIDHNLQAAAYKALLKQSQRGAVVALHAKSGAVLAMASHPSYDPNILSGGTTEQRKRHLKDIRAHNAFFNIALQGKFPPASTFKPVVALAALEHAKEHKAFSAGSSIFCPGYFTLHSARPGRSKPRFKCWALHRRVNLFDAIAKSCNVYFYSLGHKTGLDPIVQMARALGLEEKTGIDLRGEAAGLVPDMRWKQLHFSGRWYDGDTVNLSVGQGFLQSTPLQLAVFYSAIANGGKIFKPFLVREIRDPIDNHLIRKFSPRLVRKIAFDPQSLPIIKKALGRAVTHGTASRLAALPVRVAGKTGTVQIYNTNKKGKDHAWFAGFAPYNGPADKIIVVIVFIEHGVGGSKSAVPVAAEIYKAAFPADSRRKTRSKAAKRPF